MDKYFYKKPIFFKIYSTYSYKFFFKLNDAYLSFANSTQKSSLAHVANSHQIEVVLLYFLCNEYLLLCWQMYAPYYVKIMILLNLHFVVRDFKL